MEIPEGPGVAIAVMEICDGPGVAVAVDVPDVCGVAVMVVTVSSANTSDKQMSNFTLWLGLGVECFHGSSTSNVTPF